MNLNKLINYSLGGALLLGSFGCFRSIISVERKSNPTTNTICQSKCGDKCSKINIKLALNLSGIAGGLMILKEYYN